MIKDTKIISAFPGCGKSQFVRDNKDLIVLDSDSSNFSWVKDGFNNKLIRNPCFPNNYINHIINNIGKADIIFVSSHKCVRDALKLNNINYYLVYPSITIKEEYINRYKDRGNDDNFIELINNKWEDWINEIEIESYPTLIKLWGNQYINDIYKYGICTHYKEICSVKQTYADEYPTICSVCVKNKLSENIKLIEE